MEIEGRVCTLCKSFKLKEFFFFHKKNKANMYSHCVDCVKIKRSEFYNKNAQKISERSRLQRIKRSTREYKDAVNARNRIYRKDNALKMLVIWAKQKCKKYNIPFNLKESDVEYTGKCAVFGTDLVKNGSVNDNSPTLDRIIPELGYVKGNVRVISHLANRIKSNGTLDQLKLVVKYVENEVDKNMELK
jgi:hypothetical protein